MELKIKKSTISIMRIMGLTTSILGILSMLNNKSLILRLITQFSGFSLALFSGIVFLSDKRKRTLGYFLLGASVLILASIIFTCVVGF